MSIEAQVTGGKDAASDILGETNDWVIDGEGKGEGEGEGEKYIGGAGMAMPLRLEDFNICFLATVDGS
ncbi:hypothetical protein HPP92_018088 [Vanilla planifolia]|uniref:Uncharacterized protein n=1 Tax=Vanilla planifolia TaxID=51239 RepID=A0A835UM37_VANPL|nr:hypothetical protein HPP92_018088 [Vanilla planifolia]